MTPAPLAASPGQAFAGGGTRVVAFVLDLALLIFLLAALGSVLPPGHPAPAAIGLAAFLYFGLFPLTRLQATPGKAIVRIKVCARDGHRIEWHRSILRSAATLAWVWLAGQLPDLRPEPAWGASTTAAWVVFFLAWALMGATPRRQTLFDLLAGTVVVRAKASPAAIAQDRPLRARVLDGIGAVALCALLGLFVDAASHTARDRNLRARIGYALESTAPLRDKVEAFHAREGRWPTAAELGVAESTPYPDGGYYRLRDEGVVQVGFTVLPDLRGRTITLRPRPAQRGLEWQCRADPGLAQRYLPASCRN